MKFQLTPESQAEEDMLKSEFADFKPSIDVSIPLIQARSIMAASRLGVFSTLGKQSMSAKEIAQKLSLDTKGVELMLRVLVSSGYMHQDGDQYCISDLTRNTLLPDSPKRLTGQMAYAYIRWRLLDSFEDALKTGKGTDLHRKHLETPEKWAIYQQAMLDVARSVAPGVAESVPIKTSAKKMIDIGGAHGLFGALICKKHPPMYSVVIDLPGAVNASKELARSEGIDDIVRFLPGNVLEDDLGQDYDAAYIGGVIHHFSDKQNQTILRRVKNVLTPDSTVTIFDVSPSEPKEHPDIFRDAVSLLFYMNTGTQSYTSADCISWMKAAGYVDVAERELGSSFAPGHFMVSGRVQ